jgi:opacity protein-like surface antigen
MALCLSAVVALAHSPAGAQDVEAPRRELEQMKKQFDTMKGQYERAVEDMAERIKKLEAEPRPASTQPSTAQPAAISQAPPPGGQPTLLELARPREPFSLYGPRAPGQLLFDMGAAGDFIANVTRQKVETAGAGSFPGRENRFFPREVELSFFGQVDPYARAEVRIEAGEEEGGQETGVSLAEANLTLLTLPWGSQVKLGQMRNRFLYSNQIHEHDLPWPDRPNVFRNFLGEEGLQEKGLELTWVPPLPFYLEALFGVFNGDNETAFGRGSLKNPLFTGRLRTFLELTDTSALLLGGAAAHGRTSDRLRSTLAGVEAKYKYRPEGWLHPLVTVGGEGLYSSRRVNIESETEEEIDTDGDGIPDATTTTRRLDKRTRHRLGWYAYAEAQPWKRWAVGARYDWSQFLDRPGREWAIEPYVSFMPSEFLRFRLAYKHTDRDRRLSFVEDVGGVRTSNEVFFQGTFFLGAHPAHPF